MEYILLTIMGGGRPKKYLQFGAHEMGRGFLGRFSAYSGKTGKAKKCQSHMVNPQGNCRGAE
jgi:hypothetical protein